MVRRASRKYWTSLRMRLDNAHNFRLYDRHGLKQLLQQFVSPSLGFLHASQRRFHLNGQLRGNLRKVFQVP